jgi:hypothetical protein
LLKATFGDVVNAAGGQITAPSERKSRSGSASGCYPLSVPLKKAQHREARCEERKSCGKRCGGANREAFCHSARFAAHMICDRHSAACIVTVAPVAAIDCNVKLINRIIRIIRVIRMRVLSDRYGIAGS